MIEKLLYVVRPADAKRRHKDVESTFYGYEPTELYLVMMARPGDEIVAAILAATFSGDWKADRQWGDCSSVSVRHDYPFGIRWSDTNNAICDALGLHHSALPVAITMGDGPLEFNVRKSRIGGGYRPVTEIDDEIAGAQADIERITAKFGRPLDEIIEARWAAALLTGGGVQTALVRVADDDVVYVVEWGSGHEDDPDEPWSTMTSLAKHNELVSEANEAI